MTHITCRLTAKNRNQLRNPTLGNRVWATFTFLSLVGVKDAGRGVFGRHTLSPTSATTHYSSPDNAIGLVAQYKLSGYVRLD